jgi:hypothetical protein
MSHLGSRVSALLDGRLAPEEEERCWDHVHGCHSCRDLVEQEGWVKTQLAQLSFGTSETSRDFKSSLIGRCSSVSPASGSGLTAAAPFPTSTHRSRRSLVAIGGGAASACVVGVLVLGAAGGTQRVEPRPPVTDLSRPTGSAGPINGAAASRTPLAERLVAIREKIAP